MKVGGSNSVVFGEKGVGMELGKIGGRSRMEKGPEQLMLKVDEDISVAAGGG